MTKPFQYITILLFALASVLFGLRSYGQQKKDTDFRLYATRTIIEGDSTITDAIGTKYYFFHYREILQDGKFDIRIYDSGGYSQYLFFNGYIYDQKYWYHGKLVDHDSYKKVIKHFNIKQ